MIPLRHQIKDLANKLGKGTNDSQQQPELRKAPVTSVSSPTIGITYPGTTTEIAGVVCVGFGTVTLPSVGQQVYLLHIQGGARPICIGKA